MRLLKYTGLNLEDLLGRGWIEAVHPDDRDSVLEMGNTAFSRVNIRWFGTCIDIHDQKLAEQRQSRQLHIEANEKKYRLLAEAIPQIVFTATPKDGITYVNNKWFAYSGQTEEQAKNLGFLSHVQPDDRATCRLPEDTQSDIELDYSIEVRLLQSDGEYRWHLVKCISVEMSEQGRKWLGT
ncbi:8779_t:CDS:2, partial [Gigaspora rosea]